MERLAGELSERWEREGFNNHEGDALRVGYLEKYFSEYLLLKNALLTLRDARGGNKRRKYYNALRIYVYTIFENIWYGYLIGYSDQHTSVFKVNKEQVEYTNPYVNHLPSFSSAIVHMGTCRDLFYVLLFLFANREEVFGPDEVLERHRKLKDALKTDYRRLGRRKLKDDLGQVSSDDEYVGKGMCLSENNILRNFYAHRLRLPWWENWACSELDYFLIRDFYNSIKDHNNDNWIGHIEDIFINPASYEQRISDEQCSNLIGASEILREIHDPLADFLSTTFGHMADRLREQAPEVFS